MALRLWSIYVEIVDSCIGPKLLHVPTDEIRICSAMQNPEDASFENLALAFAIYYSAVSAAEPSQISIMAAGESIPSLLLRFKSGFEQALSRLNFLENPTVTSIQAVAIYLVSPSK